MIKQITGYKVESTGRVFETQEEAVEQTVNGGKPDKIEIVIRRPNVPDTDDRA